MDDLNTRFNAIVAAAPKTQKVIGQMEDGTPVTVEVPGFNFGGTE